MPQGILTKDWHTGRRLLKAGAEVNVTINKYKELEAGGYFSTQQPKLKSETMKRFLGLVEKKDEDAPKEAIDSEGDE